jgi:mono/diheme cytochrome c family protein
MFVTIWLGLAMAAIAVVNTSLMAWLWRFPMGPDPSGRDPHGVSTAPRSWTNVHRTLGYAFALIYAALAVEMVPRTWEFRAVSTDSVLHGALGLVIAALLAFKIAVIRRFRRFGNRLPWIGGTLAAATLVAVGLAVPPAWRVVQPLSPVPRELTEGRSLVARKCIQCHGASPIASEHEDFRKWDRITREMQGRSRQTPGKDVITDGERSQITAYLAHALPDTDEGENQGDGQRGRRRRGRDR